jgi:hypothetical protein
MLSVMAERSWALRFRGASGAAGDFVADFGIGKKCMGSINRCKVDKGY